MLGTKDSMENPKERENLALLATLAKLREHNASENVALTVHVQERRRNEDACLAPLSTARDVGRDVIIVGSALSSEMMR